MRGARIGGVGKTQLAAYFARAHRDDEDVVWWLRAEQPQALRSDLAALAVALGLAGRQTEQDDAIAAVSGWLERNGRWLLIADNAPGEFLMARTDERASAALDELADALGERLVLHDQAVDAVLDFRRHLVHAVRLAPASSSTRCPRQYDRRDVPRARVPRRTCLAAPGVVRHRQQPGPPIA